MSADRLSPSAVELDAHLAELRSPLDGAQHPVTRRGATAPIRHLMPDAGFVAFRPRIPMYVSAFGPRATAVAARHGDGLISSVVTTPDGVEAMWARLHEGAAAVGPSLDPAGFRPR